MCDLRGNSSEGVPLPDQEASLGDMADHSTHDDDAVDRFQAMKLDPQTDPEVALSEFRKRGLAARKTVTCVVDGDAELGPIYLGGEGVALDAEQLERIKVRPRDDTVLINYNGFHSLCVGSHSTSNWTFGCVHRYHTSLTPQPV
jgi:hypothetical protein